MTGVDIKDLTAFYKAAKIKFDEDEVFKKVAQQNVVKLQGGAKSRGAKRRTGNATI